MRLILLRQAVVFLALVVLTGCSSTNSSLFGTGSDSRPQVFPANYKSDLLALMPTYLKDPIGVREAMLSEPALREIAGRNLYVACLRYNAKGASGRYQGSTQRLVIFLDGRLDHLSETDAARSCTSAAYLPFPEMERLKR